MHWDIDGTHWTGLVSVARLSKVFVLRLRRKPLKLTLMLVIDGYCAGVSSAKAGGKIKPARLRPTLSQVARICVLHCDCKILTLFLS